MVPAPTLGTSPAAESTVIAPESKLDIARVYELRPRYRTRSLRTLPPMSAISDHRARVDRCGVDLPGLETGRSSRAFVSPKTWATG